MPDAAEGTSAKSLEEWKALVAEFHRGFSDVKMEVLLQVAEGNPEAAKLPLRAGVAPDLERLRLSPPGHYPPGFEGRPPTGP